MYERFANLLVIAVYAYLAAGITVALAIVSIGFERIDAETKGAGLGFRLVVFPGVVALWPLLLKRMVTGGGEPPTQKDPHR